MAKKKSKKKTKIQKYQKVYLVSSLLVGVSLVLFILLNMFSPKPKVIPSTTDASFSFTQTQTEENAKLTLSVNPNSNNVAFVKVKLYFDAEKLQLTDEVVVNNLALARTHIVSSMDEANEEGIVEIAVAMDPTQYPPNSPFTLADLTFSGTPGEISNVTIIDEDTQIVDDNSNLVPFSPAFAQIAFD